MRLSRDPNIEAQRAAMKKLEFMIGKWTGEARVLRGPGEPVEMDQTEEAQYKLDGLVLIVEGVGRTKSDGQIALQAFGIVSYDDESRTYWMRAFNDGRFLETAVELLDGGDGMTWAFTLGEINTRYVMRINEKGEWSELGEITIASQAPKKFMELTVRRRLGEKYTAPEKNWLSSPCQNPDFRPERNVVGCQRCLPERSGVRGGVS